MPDNLYPPLPEKPKKILAIKLKIMSGVVLASQFFDNLRRKFPESEIVLLTERSFDHSFEINSSIDRVLLANKSALENKEIFNRLKEALRLIFVLRKENFDVVFVMHAAWPLSFLAFLTGIKTRIGFLRNNRLAKFFLTHDVKRVKGRSERESSLDLLRKVGISVECKRTFYNPSNLENFFKWFQRETSNFEKPWLVLGKGPSFDKYKDFDLSKFHLMSLNHVVREMPVELAHIIDMEVVDHCGSLILDNAGYLVMPWWPHVNGFPGKYHLGDLIQKNATLGTLAKENRLLWYNLNSAKEANSNSPWIVAQFFSAEAALSLLAHAGVKKIRSLGIDGGNRYNSKFDDLKDKTLLLHNNTTFDLQFEEIRKTIFKYDLDFAPMDEESPIRIYVGAMEDQMLSVKVLEHSILKHASMKVKVFPLNKSPVEIPIPKDPRNRPRTPFSFQRFLIPELAGHKGKAIYLDSDMLVIQDIRNLWTQPIQGADLLAVQEPVKTGRRPQFSVMLMDCGKIRWNIMDIVSDLDNGRLTYEQLMFDMSIANKVARTIDSSWNCLERYEEGRTSLIHYTDLQQPWVATDNPLAYLWMRELFEALDNGFISLDFIQDQIQKKYVRPSLLYQIENRIVDSLVLPRKVRALDKEFIPPMALNNPGIWTGPWVRAGAHAKARVRRYYEKSPLFRFERKIKRRWE